MNDYGVISNCFSGGFTSEEFANISVEAISLIKTVALKQIPDALFGVSCHLNIIKLNSYVVLSLADPMKAINSSNDTAAIRRLNQTF